MMTYLSRGALVLFVDLFMLRNKSPEVYRWQTVSCSQWALNIILTQHSASAWFPRWHRVSVHHRHTVLDNLTHQISLSLSLSLCLSVVRFLDSMYPFDFACHVVLHCQSKFGHHWLNLFSFFDPKNPVFSPYLLGLWSRSIDKMHLYTNNTHYTDFHPINLQSCNLIDIYFSI